MVSCFTSRDEYNLKVEFFFRRHITDKINALQGVYLFIVMVITRHHVMKSLGSMSLCGFFLFPKRWAGIEDNDDVELIERDINGATNTGFVLNEKV